MNVRKQNWLAGLSALVLMVLLAACGDNATPTPATGNLPAPNVTNPAPAVTTAASATTQAAAPTAPTNPTTAATNVNNPAPAIPPTVAGAQASPVPTAPPPPTPVVLPTPAIPTPVFINPPANNPIQATPNNQPGTNRATSPASTTAATNSTIAPATTTSVTTAAAQNGGVNSNQGGVGNPNGNNNPVAYPKATVLPVTANLLQQYSQLVTPTLANSQIQAFVTSDGLANVTGFYNTQLTRLGYTAQIPQTINRQQFSLNGQVLNFSCGVTTGSTTSGSTVNSAGSATSGGTNGSTTNGNNQANGAASVSPAGCSSNSQQNAPGASAGSSNTASLVRVVELGPLDQPTISLLTSQFPGLPVALPVNGTVIMVFTSNSQA